MFTLHNLSRKFIILPLLICTLLFGSFQTTQAANLSDLQILLEQLRAQLKLLQTTASVQSTNCVELNRTLALGASDVTHGGQVSKLQQFLRNEGFYTFPSLTGYYGSITAGAVSAWQVKNKNIITGTTMVQYAAVDQATRVAMSRGCVAPTAGTVEVLETTETQPIVLNDRVMGHKLLDFEVDVDNNGSDLEIQIVDVNITLPFVKAGNWKDMIKQVMLVSNATQRSITTPTIADTGRVVSMMGEDQDEIMVSFEIPSNLSKFFTVDKGTDQTFSIIADFNSASGVGGFGVTKGKNSGFVRAELVNVMTSPELQTISSFYNSTGTFGPHRMIQSSN